MAMSGVVGNFLVVDPMDAVPIAGGTSFPWYGGGVQAPTPMFILLTHEDLKVALRRIIPAGREVREIMIALTNFEDEGGLTPSHYMGVLGLREMNLWQMHARDDLRKHILYDHGAVYIQVILRQLFDPEE